MAPLCYKHLIHHIKFIVSDCNRINKKGSMNFNTLVRHCIEFKNRLTELTVADVLSSAGPSLFTVLKGPAPSDILSACWCTHKISTFSNYTGN